MLNYELHRSEHEELHEEYETQGDVILKNPFPGLRPFTIDESHLFFGRENQVDDVLIKLVQNKFVTVMGYSGSGKSSLITCGVVPVVYGGFMTNSGPEWNIITTRPGTTPIANLARSIQISETENGLFQNYEEEQINRRIVSSLLKSTPGGLVDVLGRTFSAKGKNTLIFIDQFEELFRLASNGPEQEEEARLYANLIIDACRTSEYPIYISITMRSDYVGECAKYPGLTQLINESNYLVPQMSRDQKRMAIEGPISVGGGRISARLLKRLLNDLGDNQDQLPIMQHALMRTWEYWIKNREESEPIDIGHYNAIGKISEALSQHANETFDSLSTRQKEIAEILFKSLSEKTSNNFGMRRPVRLGLVAELAEATDEEVIEVVEQFRAPGRSFLMPPLSVELDADSIIEISHESLMRIWTRLKIWVDEEFESAQMYRRLSEAAAMYQIGRTGLWRPPDLQLALNWQKKQKPSRAWAMRYDETFERAIVFLDTSRITYEAEQRNQEMLQKRLLKRTRAVAVILGIAAVISILFFVYAFTQSNEAQRQAQIAQAEKLEAERQRDLATEAEKEANKQTARAEEALKEAQKQTEIAQQALAEAKKQRNIAEYNATVAQQQTTIANNQTVAANQAKETAQQQYQRAERNFNDAQRLLYQTTAQAMAVKSLAIEDEDLKGLLAQQAKQFFNEFEGRTYDTYIYDGLYSAYAQFKGEEYNTIKGLHRNAVRSLAIGKNGKYYSTGTQGKVLSSSFENKNEHATLFNNEFPNRELTISDDNTWLAASSDSSYLQVVNLTSGTVNNITGHSSFVNDVEFIPASNTFISSSNDKTLRYNNAAKSSSDLFMNTSLEIKSIAINNSGRHLVGGTIEGELILIDLVNKSETTVYSNNGQPIQSVAFSPDGELIVFGDERGIIHILNMSSKQVVRELLGHKGRVSSISFSPDGKLMASGSFDGTMQLWAVNELDALPIKITDNDSYVWDVAFTPDSKYLISACADGDIRFWPTNAQDFSDEMCSLIKRNMDEKEWKTYVGEDIELRNTCINLLLNDY